MIPQSFCQVDSSEGAFSDFFFRLEKFVKVSLVDFGFQLFHPQVKNIGELRIEDNFLLALLSFELDSQRSGQIELGLFLYNKTKKYPHGIKGLEDGFELDREAELEVVSGRLVEDVLTEYQVGIGEHEEDLTTAGTELVDEDGFLDLPKEVAFAGGYRTEELG